MQKFAKINKGYKYLLTCIDVFSKYAWVIPIKSKGGNSVFMAFREILEDGRKPEKIQSDEGKEFINSYFKNFLNKENITFYIVNSELKASVVERFNRTLKEKMWRNFTFKGKYVYIDVIKDIVKAYNNSYHRTIKMRPVDVNKSNEEEIYERVFTSKGMRIKKFALKINDKVRISKYKSVFAKGYTANWSEEIFVVSEQIARDPRVYKIRDLAGEQVEGIFYESELQKISNKEEDEGVFKVEAILRTRIRNKQKEVLIKWLGYPEKFNSWEPAANIIQKTNNEFLHHATK